jgi:hypothetical protein
MLIYFCPRRQQINARGKQQFIDSEQQAQKHSQQFSQHDFFSFSFSINFCGGSNASLLKLFVSILFAGSSL